MPDRCPEARTSVRCRTRIRRLSVSGRLSSAPAKMVEKVLFPLTRSRFPARLFPGTTSASLFGVITLNDPCSRSVNNSPVELMNFPAERSNFSGETGARLIFPLRSSSRTGQTPGRAGAFTGTTSIPIRRTRPTSAKQAGIAACSRVPQRRNPAACGIFHTSGVTESTALRSAARTSPRR